VRLANSFLGGGRILGEDPSGTERISDMRIKYEVSAGGLVLRRNGATLDALLIGRGVPRVWSLPKGHVEARETHEQAALREVREETGCWAEILIKLSDISYWFYLNRTKHKKSVHFYLMRYLSGHTDNHDHEVDEARWFEIKAAKKALKYVNEKRLVDLGLEYLEREGDSVFAFEPDAQPELELEAMRDSSAS
jgi:8-oxo-dGTP pyrophosphatase MutT (NUDIX family)